jgi:hypothetical protein
MTARVARGQRTHGLWSMVSGRHLQLDTLPDRPSMSNPVRTGPVDADLVRPKGRLDSVNATGFHALAPFPLCLLISSLTLHSRR